MNKHQKLAIFIAPVLIIIGYVGSDYYLQDQAQDSQVFKLVSAGQCDILNKQCLLSQGELKLNVFDVDGVTSINSTFPLDQLTFFMVEKDGSATPYIFQSIQTAYYWQAETPLRKRISHSAQPQQLRLIARIKGAQYISEFHAKAGY